MSHGEGSVQRGTAKQEATSMSLETAEFKAPDIEDTTSFAYYQEPNSAFHLGL